jgi:diguanylate cyclase (GGDEF)-like protein/PAS domain S-box-containing protein
MATATERLAVLLVEDDEDDFHITQDLLAAQSRTRFDMDWVSSYDAARRAIAEARHDVYLIDYRLGGLTGLDLVREAFRGEPGAPVIILTGVGDYEVDLEATLLGVTDFLVKDQLDPEVLERSIRYAVRHHAALGELRESQERYALAVRGANDGIWDWDLPSGRIYFSPRWKAILGYSDDAVADLPQEWLGRVHPGDVEQLQAAIDAHLDGQAAQLESEHRMRHRDGAYRWVLSRGVAIRDQDGTATRLAGSMTDITDNKAAEERLLHNALHDTLTGLPNRTLFLDRLAVLLTRARRQPSYRCAVLFLDLNRFKLVNDGFSHAIGDQLLVALARRLEIGLRPGDTFARLGGDEFTILLDGIASLGEAAEVAERIQHALSEPFAIDGRELVVTASIGIALSERDSRPAELMRNADIAMYDAKRQGAARASVFSAHMHSRVKSELQLEAELRRAIDDRRLRVFYQPIVDVGSGRLTGFEALARWPAAEPHVEPAEFIAMAEKTGLIGSLGRLVLNEACARLVDWRERGLIDAGVSVSVNVSARQFGDANLIPDVLVALEQNRLLGGALRLEVTESTVMQEPERMRAALEELERVGVRAHIDDFGTGYSSLAFLQHFPGDTLKIDRSFIRAMHQDEGSEAIVRAVIALAHSLDLQVIAEGVESSAQLEKLRALGCESAQGFLMSKPLDVIETERLLVDWDEDAVRAMAARASVS